MKLTHQIMPDNAFGVVYLEFAKGEHIQLSVLTHGGSSLCVYEPTVADMRAARDSLTKAITAFHLAGLGWETRDARP